MKDAHTNHSTRHIKHQAGLIATQHAWKVLRTHPKLALWKLAAELITILVCVLTMITLIWPLAQIAQAESYDIVSMLTSINKHIVQPSYIQATWGLFASWVGLSWAFGAWTDAGIWGTFGAAIRHKELQHKTDKNYTLCTFKDHARRYFVRALTWRALRTLLRLGLGTLLVMLYAALIRGNNPTHGIIPIAVVTGLMYSAAIIYVLLCILAMEMAPAHIVLEEANLGDALLKGAKSTLEHPLVVYRLCTSALSVLIIPGLLIFFFELLVQGQNLSQSSAALSSAWSLRILLHCVMVVSSTLFLIAFRGGSLWLVADILGRIHALRTQSPTSQGMERTPFAWMNKNEDKAQDFSVEHLFPQETPNIVSLSHIIKSTDSSEE